MRKKKIKVLLKPAATETHQMSPDVLESMQTSPSLIRETSGMIELREWVGKARKISREALRY